MFRACAAVALVGALAAATPALASPVSTGDYLRLASFGPGQTISGNFRGELNVQANSVNSLVGATSFITFCLEIQEPLFQGNAGSNGPFPFRVNAISDRAIDGGLPPAAGGDPITSRTAFLFQNFTLGTLAGYDYNGANRVNSAIALQSVIWELETEVADATDGIVDPDIIARINQFRTMDMGGFTGIGLVRVVNLQHAFNYGGYTAGSNAQDVLVVIPLPHTAGLGMAGLLGLIGVSAARRRR